jgi:heme-degrading monooxygenase HmoA
MYARISTYESGYPEDYDAGLASLREEVMTQIQGMPGYRGALSLIERSTGQSVSITFWDDEDALAATRQGAERIRESAAATSGSRVLSTVEYEVGYADLPVPPDPAAGPENSSPS